MSTKIFVGASTSRDNLRGSLWEDTWLTRTYAKFETSEGNFKIRLFDKEAPNTVANFVGLAEGTKEWRDPATGERRKAPFYDGIIFHRVINGFMIQGGDPLGQGTGGPGYNFADEFHPSARHDKAGHPVDGQRRARTPTAASSSSRSARRRTSTTATRCSAKSSKGMDVVKKIGAVPTGRQDRPVKPVVINKVTIERSA